MTLLADMAPIISGSVMDRRRDWYAFRAFNLYRLALGTILLGVFSLEGASRLFGKTDPTLFLWTVTVYLMIVLLSIGGSFWRRPSLWIQTHIQTLVDLISLGLLIHASGGFASSLSILLIMAVAASSILLPLYSALLAATMVFLMMLGEWSYEVWTLFATPDANPIAGGIADRLLAYMDTRSGELGHIGILGTSTFIAALLIHKLAERTRLSEALARRRSQELLEAAELNQVIIQHLQSGIIVVDGHARIRFINDTARGLLNYHNPVQGEPLDQVSTMLSHRLANWLSADLQDPKPFRQAEHLPDISPNFSHLSANNTADTLIFLEDSAQAAQQLQQIKLAALGRLSAGIAHEIRNPLASISHAAQLLKESTTTNNSDRRLGQIIHDNAKRANKIIANVLNLSKRDKTQPEDFILKPWLDNFSQEFLRGHSEQMPQLQLRVQPEDLAIRFATSQLQQILWNLCTNACVHGTPSGQTPKIRLVAALDPVRFRPYLDVIDFGPGIPEAEAKKIFEPFFTTKPRGTGLGLYIAREMCEANRGQLQYIRTPEGTSCFRITFANPSKQVSLNGTPERPNR